MLGAGIARSASSIHLRREEHPERVRAANVFAKCATLVLLCSIFSYFIGQPDHTPDIFVQRDYIQSIGGLDVPLLLSLRNNTVLLDKLVPWLQSISGMSLLDTLRWLYVAVFVCKYAMLMRLFSQTRFVLIVFLWSFSSFDLNQLRLNIALTLVPLLFLQTSSVRKMLGVASMLVVHLGSVFFLPAVASKWTGERITLSRVLTAMVVFAAAVYGASVSGWSMDERFQIYIIGDDQWIPKALLACPAILVLLYRTSWGMSRILLTVVSIAPLALAAGGFSVVSARMMEIAYLSVVIRIAMERWRLSPWRLAVLAVPAIAMFSFRIIVGVSHS